MGEEDIDQNQEGEKPIEATTAQELFEQRSHNVPDHMARMQTAYVKDTRASFDGRLDNQRRLEEDRDRYQFMSRKEAEGMNFIEAQQAYDAERSDDYKKEHPPLDQEAATASFKEALEAIDKLDASRKEGYGKMPYEQYAAEANRQEQLRNNLQYYRQYARREDMERFIDTKERAKRQQQIAALDAARKKIQNV